MAKLVTLANLKLRAREASDMVNSQFVSDEELVRYINSSIQKLYDKILKHYGQDYYVKDDPYEFTTNADNDPVALPADFYKCIGVDADLGGTFFTSIKPFNFAERNNYSNIARIHESLRYRIMGNQIRFTKSHGNTKIKVWYIPTAPQLVNVGDELDGINGYEELLIVDTAIKMLRKEETDISALVLEKKELEDDLFTSADNRDIGQPQRVTDVTRLREY